MNGSLTDFDSSTESDVLPSFQHRRCAGSSVLSWVDWHQMGATRQQAVAGSCDRGFTDVQCVFSQCSTNFKKYRSILIRYLAINHFHLRVQIRVPQKSADLMHNGAHHPIINIFIVGFEVWSTSMCYCYKNWLLDSPFYALTMSVRWWNVVFFECFYDHSQSGSRRWLGPENLWINVD